MVRLGALAGVQLYELQITGGQAVELKEILDRELRKPGVLEGLREELGNILKDFVRR